MTVDSLIDYLAQLRAEGLGGATVVLTSEDSESIAPDRAVVELEWVLRSSGE